MNINIELDEGGPAEARNLCNFIQNHTETAIASVKTAHHHPAAGTMGLGEEIIQFTGDSVAVPLLVNAIYDYLKSRALSREGQRLKVRFVVVENSRSIQTFEMDASDSPTELIEALRRTPPRT